ncbi:MAG: hypothetical protein H0T73_13230, partial [Ardenticatenales bacterium]|nr:hypothetical protein [Ardenticatenales bacterium]
MGLDLYWPAEISGALITLPPGTKLDLPATLRLAEQGYVGHIPVARLERVDAAAVHSLELHIGFSGGSLFPSTHSMAPITALTAVERVLLESNILLNPSQALQWRQSGLDQRLERQAASGVLLGHFEVREAGWYRVLGSHLLAAGIRLEQVEAARLRLTQGGTELALRLSRATGSLTSGDTLEFYVEPQLDRFRETDTVQLWLAPENETGQRVATVTLAAPAAQPLLQSSTDTIQLNPRQIYESRYPGSGGDYWFWQDLRELSFPPRTDARISIYLPGAIQSAPGTLTLSFQGISSGDHALAVHLNGQALGEIRWRGIAPHSVTLAVPAGVLEAGANELLLRSALPEGVVDGTYLDEGTVSYTRQLQAQAGALTFAGTTEAARYRIGEITGGEAILLDVTEPATPIWLSGAQTTPRYDLLLPVMSGGTGAHSAQTTAETQLPSPEAGSVYFADARPGPRRYHVASPLGVQQPVHIGRALPPVEAGTGADFIIIAPAPFHEALRPLVARRSAQGMRVRLVDLQAIYEGWGYGRPTALAIRAFLAETFARWPAPAPSYVLLVGDGSYDPRGDRFDHIPHPLPPFLAHVDPWMGETASDHQYTLVHGEDRLPDLILGRIPARSAEEVAAVVEKTLAYEGLSGAWLQRTIAVADDESPTLAQRAGVGPAALATTFASSAEMALERLPVDAARQR